MCIKQTTAKLLKGCIIEAFNGTKLYTPDGVGNYPALWTRDFAYMVENAIDLIPEKDIEEGIEYIVGAVRDDGWVPDRVQFDGIAKYTAGGDDFPAFPNLDNGCFLCVLVDEFLKSIDEKKATKLFNKWKDALINGVECLPINEQGLIYNNANPPHSPYGFTDTVCKTGNLAFETLLLWRALKVLQKWLLKCGDDKKAKRCGDIQKAIENNFLSMFLQENGMLKASTEICAQTDIWASCFSISIGFPLSENQKNGIAEWLIKNYSSVVEYGQLRHLPADEYWEKTFINVDKGTYQNGAFWATPIMWLCDTIAVKDLSLVKKTISDVLKYFDDSGVFECVNGDDRKLDTYVASATNVYATFNKYGI